MPSSWAQTSGSCWGLVEDKPEGSIKVDIFLPGSGCLYLLPHPRTLRQISRARSVMVRFILLFSFILRIYV